MKVLWVTNIPLPEFSNLVGENPLPYGGWLVDSSKKLANTDHIKLYICFPKAGVKSILKVKGEVIDYYAFKPLKNKDVDVIDVNIEKIIDEINPDIVDIHGTEMAHSLAISKICKKKNINSVVTLQGLVSFIAMHNRANLPNSVFYGKTLRNIIRKDSVYDLSKKYNERGKYEKETLNTCLKAIGRTTWDKSCVITINQKIKYYSCNESLRGSFYSSKWSYELCEKKAIFLSQGFYSIKGLHYVLEAMDIIFKRHPDAKLYIGGNNPIKMDQLKDKIIITKYGKYIKSLVDKINIRNNIIFTGPLDEKKMCERYLKSHVFVCPSSIENSPNSLGEAMILGVPSVASYVGGIPDMLKDKEEGFLYQHDAPYMLAHYICEIFENEDLALKFSHNARQRALKTHDRDENTRRLIEIYSDVLEKKVE
jgi:glycosyltransferase involved in cell wall biosynthesis